MLISAGIHYPRATPEMWPDLIAKSKEGGAEVIETYTFWNGHEPVRGKWLSCVAARHPWYRISNR